MAEEPEAGIVVVGVVGAGVVVIFVVDEDGVIVGRFGVDSSCFMAGLFWAVCSSLSNEVVAALIVEVVSKSSILFTVPSVSLLVASLLPVSSKLSGAGEIKARVSISSD